MINSNTSYANINKKPAFKGLDATRPIKALHLLVPNKIALPLVQELEEIGKKEHFKVISQVQKGFFDKASKIDFANHYAPYTWLQDMAMLLPENRLFYQDFFDFNHSTCRNIPTNYVQRLASQIGRKFFNPNINFQPRNFTRKPFELIKEFAGGNIYQMKNKMGYNCVLIGKDCEKTMDMSQLYETFKTTDVDFVPQAAFHIDMFLRPLANGKILVADDKLTLQWLDYIQQNMDKLPNMTAEKQKSFAKFINNFKKAVARNDKSKKYATTEEVIQFLESKNTPKCKKYDVVRVPGRIFNANPDWKKEEAQQLADGTVKIAKKTPKGLAHDVNYMNGIVQKREDGSLVYITNRSNPEHTGDVELDGLFAKYLKKVCPEIKEVYFVGGKDNYGANELKFYNGGIHCRVMEEPASF